MWRLVILKRDSFILAISSIIYGLQLYLHPSILENFKVYQVIREMFDHRIVGVVFMAVGILKLIGIIINSPRIKYFAVRVLIFLWLLFMVSFIITPPPNTVWIMALTYASLGLGIITKEE